jgi:hypothetical protein
MALRVRRVITGHDENGRAKVLIDEVATHVVSGRPGATSCNIWTTEGFPANNDGAADAGLRSVATTLPNGTIFRIIEFAPGLAPRNHRTDSIDYIVIISGEIDRARSHHRRSFRQAHPACSRPEARPGREAAGSAAEGARREAPAPEPGQARHSGTQSLAMVTAFFEF